MAPEQLRGEQVDARTDIYALGAVLYEMATAQRAFPETQTGRLMDALLHQAPQPPSGLNRRVSPGLEGIILKALEKEPENRYQHANELAVDLRRLGTPGSAAAVLAARRPARRRRMVWAAGVALVALLAVLVGLNVAGLRDRLLGGVAQGQITSLAVLPLANLSGDPEQEYFADGMTDALIGELAQISALRVISRQSVMRYKGTDKPLPEIARELNVDAVVEGSVLRAGERIRVTAQLIGAVPERHLWAQSYERDLRDILTLQSEVARAVAREIKVAVTPEEETRLARARPVDPEAYEAYLKGRYYTSKWTEEGLKKGIDYFRQAIDVDPTYALAYAGLAEAYESLSWFAYVPPNEGYPKAKAAALKALELDDTLAEAHASLGVIKFEYDWDWAGAEQEIQRALELNPNSVAVLVYGAFYFALTSRFDEAIAANERAIELDPLTPTTSSNLGTIYYLARRYEESVVQLRKTLDLDPNADHAHMLLALDHAKTERYEEAIASCENVSAFWPDPAEQDLLGGCGWVYGVSGRRDEALKLLDQLKEFSKRRWVDPVWVAMIYVGLGDKDQTFRWLRKSYEEHSPSVVWFKVAPHLDSLRSDPRFQSLLRRMNFPE